MKSSGVTKAVILARGMGTRMRRAEGDSPQLDAQQAQMADSGLKAMIPVGRPFLDYVLSGLADAGFREVCLVIGPEHGIVRDYYREAASAPIDGWTRFHTVQGWRPARFLAI